MKFYLEEQEGRPGKPGFFLTNPDNTNQLVLREQDFSPSQTWSWSNNMLMCGTGKVLDADGRFNGAPVLAMEPVGGRNQEFYPFKIISPNIPGQEFCLIGRLDEKDEKPPNSERVFFNIKGEGRACLTPVSSYMLDPMNENSILDESWNFVYRQVPVEEENIEDSEKKTAAGATMGDLVGVMGGLMAAFEHGAALLEGKRKDMKIEEILPEDDILTVSSDDGGASSTNWYRMGTYRKTDMEHNGRPVWVSLECDVQKQEIFYTKAQYWMIGTNRRDTKDEKGGIKSAEAGLDYPPVQGWQHMFGDGDHTLTSWSDDHKLTVAAGRTVVYPNSLLVSSQGSAAKNVSYRMGKYLLEYERKMNGRPIWRHEENDGDIFYTGKWWYIGRRNVDPIRHPHIGLVRIPTKGWEVEVEGEWLADEHLTVTEIIE